MSSKSSRSDPAESLLVAALLTFTGGFLDAFTYVGHGKVFANSMTGNVVFLGIALAQHDLDLALHRLLPIIAFLGGAVAARLVRLGLRQNWKAEATAITIEVLMMGAVILWGRLYPDSVIVLGIAFTAAMQSTTFARIRGQAYNSTMTTGNIRHLAEQLFSGFVPSLNREALRTALVFGLICGCFFLGATAGAVATSAFQNAALLFPQLSLLAVPALLFVGRPIGLASV